SDKVEYENRVLTYPKENFYIMLNKPPGYLVSHNDDFGRKLVYDLLPKFDMHLFAVGRLDYRSEGLLLLTNDGDFAQKIIHPRHKLTKTYRVDINKHLTEEELQKLRSGMKIDKKKTMPAKVFVKNKHKEGMKIKITIYEGRKRQIRKMMEQVDAKVLRLKRTQIGSLRLGKIQPGTWRLLTESEIKNLKREAMTSGGK
ncbi:MAG: pseudouridine synthase, partial [Candidatus Cloacimonadota bacterium]|nr:pseudouridine synthase [Candidatus Cloacimonadota bacterium]